MSQADFDFSRNYLKILEQQFSGLNLTRIQDLQMFHVEQFQDSLSPLEKCPGFKGFLKKEKLLVDVGFGGGFPLLPLAFRCPFVTFIGFERKEKKVLAVRTIAKKLGLSNVLLFHGSIEDISLDLPCVVTFKGVGPIKNCLDRVFPLESSCRVLFYKGPLLEEKEGGSFKECFSWELLEDVSFSLGHTSRRLLFFQNSHVPRGTKPKNLVKLSSLF